MAHSAPENDEIISGINVTPLVDVILVVLIIFIVTASVILRSSIPVNLPQAKTAEQSTSGLLNVSITREGQIYINGRPARLDDLRQAVAGERKMLPAGKAAPSAFVSADVKAQYGLFAQVVDRLRLEGVSEIALDTRPAEIAEPRR